ncbi:unnamed protein product [Sympodiomycopsis kandeliae]
MASVHHHQQQQQTHAARTSMPSSSSPSNPLTSSASSPPASSSPSSSSNQRHPAASSSFPAAAAQAPFASSSSSTATDVLTPPTSIVGQPSPSSIPDSKAMRHTGNGIATDDEDEANPLHHTGNVADVEEEDDDEDDDDDDEDHDQTMRERSPSVPKTTQDQVRNKRTSSGSYRQVLPERKKKASSPPAFKASSPTGDMSAPAASASTSNTPSLMLMAIAGHTTPPVSSSRTTIQEEDEDDHVDHFQRHRQTERASVLQDSARKHKRIHRRRPSASSMSSHNADDYNDHDHPARSRTPSPILGDAYPYAGAASRPGHIAPPTPGPSAADIHSLLYNDQASSSNLEVTLPDSAEINAIIAKVQDMAFKEQTSASASHEPELGNMINKLGQHALEQSNYIRTMEETLHNTRVTAVSVISSLTASHAYEIASERQLRDRLEVELEGAQASARMLSSLLAKAQNRNNSYDRDRAASIEEEMRWAATLPMSSRKVSGASTITANSPKPASTTPTKQGQGTSTGQDKNDGDASAAKTENSNVIGLGMTGTSAPTEYADILDSPMSAVITERNKLAADKKYLRTRVRDAEAQLHRLENELKALRPLLVHGGARALMAASGPSAPNTPSHRHAVSNQQTPSRSKRDRSRRRKMITMGDAEAEHLLLAARRLNHAKSMGSLPTFSEQTSPFKRSTPRFPGADARPRTPPQRNGGLPPRTPGTTDTAAAFQTPRSTGGKTPHGGGLMDSLLINGTPGAAFSGSPQSKQKPLYAHHARLDSNASNASFTGMDELLHAAQSVLTPRDRMVNQKMGGQMPAAPSGEPSTYFPAANGPPRAPLGTTGGIFDGNHLAHDSPKRRRVSVTALENERPRIFSASPQARHLPGLAKAFAPSASAQRLRTKTEGADVPNASNASPGAAYQRLRGAQDPDEAGSVGPLSALDLLADQAAASQNPSQSSEPSVSDGEKRGDGFSSQEEGPSYSRGGRGENEYRERGHERSGSYAASHQTPRGSAASSLMAARARVSGAPLAYAHSIAPTPDYAQPRYPYGGQPHAPPPGPPPHGASMSSPVTPSHHMQSLPPIHDAYAPRGVTSSGHLGPGPGPGPGGPVGPPGYMTNLPPINTSIPHHHHAPGPHTHAGHGHPMHGAVPPGPMSAGPTGPHHHPHGPGGPHGHPISHGHHHSLPGMNTMSNGYPMGSGARGDGSSPTASPVTADYPTPRHHKSSASLASLESVGGASNNGGLPPSGGNNSSSSTSSSKGGPKPKGGNTSPDKRLPYVRWTSEEDTKLKHAIAHYGQRWEAVAKAVGTRSYHQCRQRALLMRRKGLDPGNGSSGMTSGKQKGNQEEGGSISNESGNSALEEGVGDDNENDNEEDE